MTFRVTTKCLKQASNATLADIRFKFADINVNTVATSLSNLKVSKATGMDNIPAKILKMSYRI